jgi:hypothetical protein
MSESGQRDVHLDSKATSVATISNNRLPITSFSMPLDLPTHSGDDDSSAINSKRDSLGLPVMTAPIGRTTIGIGNKRIAIPNAKESECGGLGGGNSNSTTATTTGSISTSPIPVVASEGHEFGAQSTVFPSVTPSIVVGGGELHVSTGPKLSTSSNQLPSPRLPQLPTIPLPQIPTQQLSAVPANQPLPDIPKFIVSNLPTIPMTPSLVLMSSTSNSIEPIQANDVSVVSNATTDGTAT